MSKRINRKRRLETIIIGLLIGVSLLFLLPMPTAELAVRKELLIKQPAKLFTEVKKLELTEDMLDSSEAMYHVGSSSRPFVLVKRIGIGYMVTSSGTAP